MMTARMYLDASSSLIICACLVLEYFRPVWSCTAFVFAHGHEPWGVDAVVSTIEQPSIFVAISIWSAYVVEQSVHSVSRMENM